MPTTTNVEQVKLNIMTKAQYATATKANDELYVVTDEQFANDDLSNITATGKEVCAHMAMPSANVVTLTLGADGTEYIAPADGYVVVFGIGTSSLGIARIIGGDHSVRVCGVPGGRDPKYIELTLPVSKGMSFYVYYNDFVVDEFLFVYAKGAQ